MEFIISVFESIDFEHVGMTFLYGFKAWSILRARQKLQLFLWIVLRKVSEFKKSILWKAVHIT
jgi:hypothetical protein